MGYWGKHMKTELFKVIKDYQKVKVSSTNNGCFFLLRLDYYKYIKSHASMLKVHKPPPTQRSHLNEL